VAGSGEWQAMLRADGAFFFHGPGPVLSHFPCEHQSKLAALAAVCNRYPNVSLEYQVVDADEVSAGEQVQIVVKLERENEVLSVLS